MVNNILAKLYDQTKLNRRKTKLDTRKDKSEDELLKFFLHGSYEIQCGDIRIFSSQEIDGNNDKIAYVKDDKIPICHLLSDDKQTKSRCMFEETYMINISIKQPHTIPTEKQVDVCIEQTSSNMPIENENVEEIYQVALDDINTSFTDNSIEVNDNNNWCIDQRNEDTSRKLSIEKTMKTASNPSLLQALNSSTKIKDDENLFHYLNYLETKPSILVI
jgi:hypothetical protein